MNSSSVIGLLQIDLPGGTVRLCDGGFIVFGGQTFTSHDALLGSIAAIDGLGEGVGDEVPGMQMTFLPAGDAAAADLIDPDNAGARCRFWVGEYSPATGLLVGTPTVEFDGQIDTVVPSVDGGRTLEVAVVSLAEKLFDGNRGNSLSPAHHKSIWAGELGHDNATGLQIPIAWGVESGQAAAATASGAGRYADSAATDPFAALGRGRQF